MMIWDERMHFAGRQPARNIAKIFLNIGHHLPYGGYLFKSSFDFELSGGEKIIHWG
jgi:hypothetical protein